MQELTAAFQEYLASGSPIAYAAVFAGGVLIGFTPCIYPVLPITVGYIGSRSGGSRARGFFLSVFYALGMAATYAVLGSDAALAGTVFGQGAASPLANFLVGIVCLLMALSLFDLFHLPVPSFLSASRGKARGGIIGAFAVGAASGLVVGPCTAPVLGSLLFYVGTRKNLPFGASLLFLFALGMGVLPVLAGTFAGLLASLPKSGRWMETVRKGFGILLILVGGTFLVEAGKLLV